MCVFSLSMMLQKYSRNSHNFRSWLNWPGLYVAGKVLPCNIFELEKKKVTLTVQCTGKNPQCLLFCSVSVVLPSPLLCAVFLGWRQSLPETVDRNYLWMKPQSPDQASYRFVIIGMVGPRQEGSPSEKVTWALGRLTCCIMLIMKYLLSANI